MKHCLYLFIIIISGPVTIWSQESSFPKNWAGNWKGELLWYKGTSKEPQKVAMELRIHPEGRSGKYSWQIIYGGLPGSDTSDNRPYTLIVKDTSTGHWAIDENNGIILDQFWIGNKLSGAFTVGNSTILNNYWMENGKLMVEFYNISAKPVASTGKGTKESPSVLSYKVGSYQKAVLNKL